VLLRCTGSVSKCQLEYVKLLELFVRACVMCDFLVRPFPRLTALPVSEFVINTFKAGKTRRQNIRLEKPYHSLYMRLSNRVNVRASSLTFSHLMSLPPCLYVLKPPRVTGSLYARLPIQSHASSRPTFSAPTYTSVTLSFAGKAFTINLTFLVLAATAMQRFPLFCFFVLASLPD